MIFTANVSNGISVRFTGDVIKTARVLSLGMPTESVIVEALGQARMAFLAGEMVANEDDITTVDIDLKQFSVEWEYPITEHWKSLDTSPLYRPMMLVERFRLAVAENVLDCDDRTTESDVEGYDPQVYGEFLDSLNVRKYIEV